MNYYELSIGDDPVEFSKYADLTVKFAPFDINCQRVAIAPIIRALSPEIEVGDKKTLERIFTYMELVRELDRDKLFIMVNMRSYFPDKEMEAFTESACLHDFKVLLLENYSQVRLEHTKRFVVDIDLCEF